MDWDRLESRFPVNISGYREGLPMASPFLLTIFDSFEISYIEIKTQSKKSMLSTLNNVLNISDQLGTVFNLV